MFPVFATPCLTHQVTLEFFLSYLRTSQVLSQNGIPHACIQVGGDCFVAKARNKLVHQFLTDFPTATDLFFIDDDVGWQTDTVLRLLRADVAVAAAVYPHKQDAPSFPVDLEARDGEFIEHDGLLRAGMVPAGFLRIRRSVIERMVAGCPTYLETSADGSTATVWEVFHTVCEGGYWYGEDIKFCRDLRDMGIDIWVDPTAVLTHTGRKRWTGTLMDGVKQWRERNAT